MISVKTASILMDVNVFTIRRWVVSHKIGTVIPAASEEENDRYQVDPIALFFFANGAFDALHQYRNGDLDRSHVESLRGDLGVGAGTSGDDDMTKKYPLLIEFARPYVDADVRRSIFKIAEARGLKPLDVLIAGFDAAKADAALQENVS